MSQSKTTCRAEKTGPSCEWLWKLDGVARTKQTLNEPAQHFIREKKGDT